VGTLAEGQAMLTAVIVGEDPPPPPMLAPPPQPANKDDKEAMTTSQTDRQEFPLKPKVRTKVTTVAPFQ
jgi:hypothetical protein